MKCLCAGCTREREKLGGYQPCSNTKTPPAVNSIWIHHNGNRYRVIFIANQESTQEKYPLTIVYENIKNGTVWTRPVNDWHRSFKMISI